MDAILIIVGILTVAGVGLAIYELRRGRPFQIEHLYEAGNSEAGRELTRIGDEVQNRTLFNKSH